MDFDYELSGPVPYSLFAGELATISFEQLSSGNGMTTLTSELTGARFTLMEPDAPVSNAQISGGMVTADLAGHRLLIDQGQFSFNEVDAGGTLIAAGSVDFSVSPLLLDIESGQATFSETLSGPLTMSLHSAMSPNYFPGYDAMLVFRFLHQRRRRARAGERFVDFRSVTRRMRMDRRQEASADQVEFSRFAKGHGNKGDA